jgi:photosystem II stability/assembly factor-like uncharacterized protein
MRKNLKILIIVFFVFTANIYSQQYWLNLGSATSRNLLKCSFVDTLNGWAVGDSGTIIHTNNGGYNWVIQNSHITDNIVTVQFINARLGWAIAACIKPEFWGSIILKTSNGGIDWDTSRYIKSDVYFNALHFHDSLTGYLGSGNPAVILKTTNAGANWIECFLDTSTIFSKFRINKFRFFNNKFGIACGGITDIAGVIWKTTDYGNYWTAAPVSYEPNFDIKIFDTSNIITLGGDFEYGASVTRTTNGGTNWTYKGLFVYGIPQALEFRTYSEGWSPLGYTPLFLKTSDAGLTWNSIDTPDSTQIFDLVFLNNKFGLCVGTHGTILRFNSSVINIYNNEINYPESTVLFQNYPNPFNPETNIDFKVSEISYIELKICNILGQEIEELFKGFKLPGTYSLKFSGKNLPSGIYYCKILSKSIKNKEKIKTKKMILLK